MMTGTMVKNWKKKEIYLNIFSTKISCHTNHLIMIIYGHFLIIVKKKQKNLTNCRESGGFQMDGFINVNNT